MEKVSNSRLDLTGTEEAIDAGPLLLSDLREFNFGSVGQIPLVTGFESRTVTSDSGIVPALKYFNKLNIFPAIAACFEDKRSQAHITYTVEEMARQIVTGDMLGYSNCSEWDDLRHELAYIELADDKFHLARGQPLDALSSQDTLLTFLNSVAKGKAPVRTMRKIGRKFNKLLAGLFVESLGLDAATSKKKLAKMTLELEIDSTDVKLHGKQEGAYYNTHYGCYCYHFQCIYCNGFPLAMWYVTADHGGAHRTKPLIEQTIDNLRELLGPEVWITVRGDGAFSQDEIMSYLEGCRNADYVLGRAGNPVLERMLTHAMELEGGQGYRDRLERKCQQQQRKITKYFSFTYSPKTKKQNGRDRWKRERKMSVKIQFTPRKGELFCDVDTRFVVSNLRGNPKAEKVYNSYRRRGNMENWIKESKLNLDIEHASLSRLVSNILRGYFKIFAHSLMMLYRARLLKGTSFTKSTCQTIREKLFKIGAVVAVKVREFRFSMSRHYPYKNAYAKVCLNLKEIIGGSEFGAAPPACLNIMDVIAGSEFAAEPPT